MSDILERIAQLSSDKRALLEAMLAKEPKTREVETIPRRGDSQAPLSYAQQRIWFLDQMDPGDRAYNVPAAIRLSGKLDVAALQRSLEEIAKRHESLRTVFSLIDGKAVQIVAEPEGRALSLIDLSELDHDEREAQLLELGREEAAAPFDLTRGPLFRTRLVSLEEHEHALLLTMHHIVSDGWSLGVFIREMAALYEAFSEGKPSPLNDLSIQYADYAQWQREQLNGEGLEKHLSYWREELKGAPLVLELPADRPRPLVQRTRGKSLPFTLPKTLSDSLEALSRAEATTLYMTLLAAFQTLLYRYTGQKDFLVGSAIANRNRAETESLIGLFVNSLPLRARLADDLGFRQLLKKVSNSAIDANAHQDLPFSMLVEELQPQRALSHTPLFQVMFVFQNLPIEPLALPGLRITPVEVEDEVAKFDLSLSMVSGADGLSGRLVYNTDLFDEATIKRTQGHLQSLLEAIVADPDQHLSALPLATERERRQLLYEFNNGEFNDSEFNHSDAHFEDHSLIHEHIEQQARGREQAPAIECEGEILSYGELNRRANQLAHYLRRLGVEPDTRVAAYLQPSVDMVISLLAILKAGGAYVPLSPACPKERLSFMLADTASAVLITQEPLLKLLPEDRPEAICLDSEFENIAYESQEDPAVAMSPDNLAYVIYTSGSTGKPKGVMVTHRNVSRLFSATEHWFGFDESDIWTFFHSYAFDFSVWELWGALRYGGQVLVIPYWMSRSPETFFEHLIEKRVTVLSQTPSSFNQLMRVDESEGGRSELVLKTVIFGGEALKPDSLMAWKERRGVIRPRLVNMYGITETTVHVTYHALTDRDISQASGSSVGRPIPDLQVHLLDGQLQPVPIGIAGQVYVSGAGLARGYLNRAGLTAERFLPNPFSRDAGARLYKTGDLARYREAGTIDYLGRVDQQVKIRGFRIELGEIEAALREHAAVDQCAITVREDIPEEKRIIAYFVPKQGQSPAVDELRDFLKQKLPDYMLPAAFVPLSEILLTQNGKLDHSALPAPDSERPRLATAFESPRTEAERILAGIWSSLLGIDDIGIHDNFFELGGDSILVIQVVARARQAGLRLTPKHLFQGQTIAELAAVVGDGLTVLSEQNLVTGEVLLTPIQRRFFELGLRKVNHFNQAILLEAGSRLSGDLLERVVAHLLQHHDALRMRYQRREGAWQQINSDHGGFDVFSTIDLSAINKSQQGRVMESAAERLQRSLDIEQGPLVRVTLFERGRQQPSCLLVIVHHLVVDGVSWRLLLEDLQKGYKQLERGENIDFGAKSTSFKRWAEVLKEYAQSAEITSELDYWLQQQSDLRLKPEFTRGEPTIHSSRAVTVSFTKSETQSLLQSVSKAHKDQTIDALLAALLQSFARWSSERSLVVELERHGREEVLDHVDLTSTVGWFTGVFPVQLELDAEEDEAAVLMRVRNQLGRIPNKGLGYGLLCYLSEQKDVGRQLKQIPRPEVSFNYLGQLDQVIPTDSLFVAARGRSGATRDSGEQRSHLLDVTANVAGGHLRVSFEYSQNLFSRSRIEQLAGFYVAALKSIIAYCQAPEAGEMAEVFADGDLTNDDLTNILAEIAEV